MHKTAPSYVSNEQKIKKAQTLNYLFLSERARKKGLSNISYNFDSYNSNSYNFGSYNFDSYNFSSHIVSTNF